MIVRGEDKSSVHLKTLKQWETRMFMCDCLKSSAGRPQLSLISKIKSVNRVSGLIKLVTENDSTGLHFQFSSSFYESQDA